MKAFMTRSRRGRTSGFRTDVLEALREQKVPVTLPCGNFSGYNWLDVSVRRTSARAGATWPGSPSTNQFGTDEFIEFCRAIDSEPMLASIWARARFRAQPIWSSIATLTGTYYADLRWYGHKEPYMCVTGVGNDGRPVAD